MAAGKLSSLKMKALAHANSSDDDEEQDTGNDHDLGLSLEKLNLGPRKKLLVLALGGLLVHRVFRKNNAGSNRPPDVVAGNFLVYKRPFCGEFMSFCFERFEMGLWSSAREWNIDSVLSTINRGTKDKLLFVWDQKECTNSGFESLEKKNKPIFLKELKNLWEDPAMPWRKGQYSSSNTLLIDDEPYKALRNPSNTAIFPHSYKVENGNDSVLGPEGELRLFLEGLADAEDVPSYVKEHPIGQPAITASHSNWGYYSKIIRSLG